jgi:hypothetical protein
LHAAAPSLPGTHGTRRQNRRTNAGGGATAQLEILGRSRSINVTWMQPACPEPPCAQPERPAMCRNIKTLFNFEPPATELEIRDASLQFVRKLSGFNLPSQANREAFERAVDEVAATARTLIASLVTHAPPRTREAEAERARQRSLLRFGPRDG